MASTEEQVRERLVQQAMQRRAQLMAARQQLQQQPQLHQALQMGTAHDDIPITEPADLNLFNGWHANSHPDFAAFQTACRTGPLSAVESVVDSKPRTPAFLHQGLVQALAAGNIDAAHYLLGKGAPITRQTPEKVLSAPDDCKIALFDLLEQHGWSPNTPGFYGATLLPRVVTSPPLLAWFLAHGADPNIGEQPNYRDRLGAPDNASCAALEAAAVRGDAESVRMLLEAGARISNGAPLYYAAGACQAGANPHAGAVVPSREFDEGRIPIMELLVEHGADVNGKLESRHMTAQYPIVNAVMAGAVERVRWLLSRGADPDLKGQWGSAKGYASRVGTEEMRAVLGIEETS